MSNLKGDGAVTLRRILPFIDGVNYVQKIAQLADVDLEYVVSCVRQLQ